MPPRSRPRASVCLTHCLHTPRNTMWAVLADPEWMKPCNQNWPKSGANFASRYICKSRLLGHTQLQIATVIFLLVRVAARAQQTTNERCSPTIADVGGNVTVNLTCNLSRAEEKLNAVENIRLTLRALRGVVVKKIRTYFPSLQSYLAAPDAGNWQIVINDFAALQLRLVDAAIKSS